MSGCPDHIWAEFDSTLARDLFNMIAGDHLGGGIAREVFVHGQDSDLVLKIETESRSFQNVLEWEAWQRLRDTEHAKWFAPCVSISSCGLILVQKRTMPALHYPDTLPAFITDTHMGNFGTIDGQFVCHDYGANLLMERGMTKRMVKANWS